MLNYKWIKPINDLALMDDSVGPKTALLDDEESEESPRDCPSGDPGDEGCQH
jgi:hypothetical protein